MTQNVIRPGTGRGSEVSGLPQFDNPTKLVWRMLWCDQGMANLVEVHGDSGEVALILIDFGTELMRKSTIVRKSQAASPVAKIRKALDDNDGYLDLLVVSHQDTDHWSLLDYLYATYDDPSELTVGKVARGGSDWGKKAKAAVKRYADRTTDISKDFVPWSGATVTDYEVNTGKKTKIADFGGVVFRVLCVNAPVSGSASMRKNGTSAVIVAEVKNWTFIFPGDATWETLGEANRILAAWQKKKKKSAVIPCLAMGAPHHGAMASLTQRRTRLSVREYLQATEFVNLTRPTSVGVSAGSQNAFFHPYKDVLNLLGKHAGVAQKHSTFVYDEKKNSWEVNDNEERAIFTTVLSGPNTINEIKVADWDFSFDFSTNKVTYTANEFIEPTPAFAVAKSKAGQERRLERQKKRQKTGNEKTVTTAFAVSLDPIAPPHVKRAIARPASEIAR